MAIRLTILSSVTCYFTVSWRVLDFLLQSQKQSEEFWFRTNTSQIFFGAILMATVPVIRITIKLSRKVSDFMYHLPLAVSDI